MPSKKTENTATENKNIAPEKGWLVRTYYNGSKYLRRCNEGESLEENETFLATDSYETACIMSGVEFDPISRYSFNKETLDEFAKREKSIKNNESKIDKAFEKIAFDIYWINAKKAYVAGGYDTIVKYTDSKFGYGKTTCYSLISIVDRFAKRDENGVYLEEFDPIVKGYSVSKLSLMTVLTNEQITAKLKPSMSVRDIKAAVKVINESALTDQSEDTGTKPDSGEDTGKDTAGTTGKSVIDSTAHEVITNTIISYKGAEDYKKNVDYERINSLIARVINAHPEAVINISYTLPESGKGA